MLLLYHLLSIFIIIIYVFTYNIIHIYRIIIIIIINSNNNVNHATLLGSPLGSASMHSCLEEQLHQLNVLGDRLCHLQMHDPITILRHSFSIPKLLHILRTSPTFSSPLLGSWDQLMMSIVSKITNLDFIQGSTS